MPEYLGKSDDSRFPRISFEAGLIFFIALLLSLLGIIIQTSAGQYHNSKEPLYTAYMQAMYLVPAVVAYFIFSRINLEYFRKYVWWIFVAALLLLLSIYIPGFGKVVNGSRRWVDLGPFNLQVSDPAKVALVFVLAHCLAGSRRYFLPAQFKWFKRSRRKIPLPTRDAMNDFFRGFLIPCSIIGAVCAGIVIEPDLGTTALCAAVGLTMLFLAGARLCYFIWSVIPTLAFGAAAIPVMLFLMKWFPEIEQKIEVFSENRWRRFLSFLYTEELKADDSYQLWQALTGFANGRLYGEGLGNGMIYRGFLPEAHTDCVFAVIGEELGFCGTVLIPVLFLVLFGLILVQLRKIADVFYFNICLGASLFIFLQALINMLVNLGLLPTKGMSLPFISYGGSNLVVMFVFVGLICNAIRNWPASVLPRPSEF